MTPAELHAILDRAIDAAESDPSVHAAVRFLELVIRAEAERSHDFGRHGDAPFCRRCELAHGMAAMRRCAPLPSERERAPGA